LNEPLATQEALVKYGNPDGVIRASLPVLADFLVIPCIGAKKLLEQGEKIVKLRRVLG
jgi:hypothetical protein